jgi:hypothetical protein
MENMSVRTRSGKYDAIQNPQTINPRRRSTLINGLLEGVAVWDF